MRRTRLGIENAKTVKAFVSPSPRDLEWAAGFIEGEGAFGRSNGTERIQATQRDPEAIRKLQRLFGGTLSPHGGGGGGPRGLRKYGPYPTWWVTGPRARGIMMSLYSLMSERRQGQIRVALGVQIEKEGEKKEHEQTC